MPTFTIPLRDFRRLVEVTAPFTSKDPLSPACQYIRFYQCGKHLTATATDRYTIGRARVECTASEGTLFHLKASEARAVLAAFKATRRSEVLLTITGTGEGTMIALAEGVIASGAHLTMEFDAFEGEWPVESVDRLLRTTATADETPDVCSLNTTFIRRLPIDHLGAVTTRKGKVHGFYGDDWAVVIMALSDYRPALAARLESWAA